jgi:hypothetical protein
MAQWRNKYSLLMEQDSKVAGIHLAQSVGLLSPDYGSGEMRYLIRTYFRKL